MARYLHRFATDAEFSAAYNGDDTYYEPWVSYTDETEDVEYNKTEQEKQLRSYLTFDILSEGNIFWCGKTGTGLQPVTTLVPYIEYSLNGGEWTKLYTQTEYGETILNALHVTTGDIVRFRGSNQAYGANTGTGISSAMYCSFGASAVTPSGSFVPETADFNVRGNLMSLIDPDPDVFETLRSFPTNSSWNFTCLFRNTMVHETSHLYLPVENMTDSCYRNMFSDCTRMTDLPNLTLVKNLAPYCFAAMFARTDVTEIPKDYLPWMTMAEGCYNALFTGCSGLTGAPDLPAMTLAQACYNGTFRDCLALRNAPVLPATAMAPSCYLNLFYNCSSLESITCLAVTRAPDDTTNWVYGVQRQAWRTFTKKAGTSWSTGDSGIPSVWTVIEV